MALMPAWARRLTGTHHPALIDRLLLAPSDQLKARIIRFAYPILPCKQLALARFGVVQRVARRQLPGGALAG